MKFSIENYHRDYTFGIHKLFEYFLQSLEGPFTFYRTILSYSPAVMCVKRAQTKQVGKGG